MNNLTRIKKWIKQYPHIVINVILVIAEILLVTLLIKYSDISVRLIIQSFKGIRYYYLVMIFLSFFVSVFFSSLRWKMALGRIADISSVTNGFFMYYNALSKVSGKILPYVGQLAPKVASLKYLYKTPAITTAISVLIDNIFNLLVLILLVASSVLFYFKILSFKFSIAFSGIILILMSLLFIFCRTWVLNALIVAYNLLYKMALRVPLIRNKIKSFSLDPQNIHLFGKGTILKLLYCTYLEFLFYILWIYILAVSLDLNISFSTILIIGPLVFFLTILSSVPNGVGIYELGWFGLLVLMQVDRPNACKFVIAIRISSELALIVVVLVTYCYYTFNRIFCKPPLDKIAATS